MEMKVEVFKSQSGPNLLFPPDVEIPVLVAKNVLSSETCASLSREILKREEAILRSSSAVKVAGLDDGLTTRWLSYNLMTWDLPEIQECRDAIKNAYLHFLKAANLRRWESEISCWANVLRKGEAFKAHHHNFRARPVISATISLTSSKTATCYTFPFQLQNEATNDFAEQIQIPTRAGNLIMVPGWVSHFTTPTSEENPRITLGLDIASPSKVAGSQIPFDSEAGEFHI
jgi:hypothetical protein